MYKYKEKNIEKIHKGKLEVFLPFFIIEKFKF